MADMRGIITHCVFESIQASTLPSIVAARARLDKDAVARILGYGRADWVPLTLFLETLLPFWKNLSGADFRAMYRDANRISLDSSLLRGLVQVVTRLVDLSPKQCAKHVPRAYPLIVRGCGTARYVEQPGHSCTIHLLGFNWNEEQRFCFYEGLAGCFEDYYRVCGVEGRVLLSTTDAPMHSARFEMQWGDTRRLRGQ